MAVPTVIRIDETHQPTSASSQSALKYFDWPVIGELASKIAGSASAPTNPRELPLKMSFVFFLSANSPYSSFWKMQMTMFKSKQMRYIVVRVQSSAAIVLLTSIVTLIGSCYVRLVVNSDNSD
jgi:hypothetical protein